MSGGSYDYLYLKEAIDFISSFGSEDRLDEMIERLEGLSLSDVCHDSRMIRIEIDTMRTHLSNLDERIYKVKEVWRSVEYMDSLDCGLNDVIKEVEKYRKLK